MKNSVHNIMSSGSRLRPRFRPSEIAAQQHAVAIIKPGTIKSVFCLLLFAFCLLSSFSAADAFAQFKEPGKIAVRESNVPATLKDIGIDQKLDEQIPLDLKFVDEHGKQV